MCNKVLASRLLQDRLQCHRSSYFLKIRFRQALLKRQLKPVENAITVGDGVCTLPDQRIRRLVHQTTQVLIHPLT